MPKQNWFLGNFDLLNKMDNKSFLFWNRHKKIFVTKTSTFTWGEISEILELTIKTANISEVIGVGFSYFIVVALFICLILCFLFLFLFQSLKNFHLSTAMGKYEDEVKHESWSKWENFQKKI